MSGSVRLTRDAGRLLAMMYKRYLNSIADGIPRRSARYFIDSEQIRALFLPDMDLADVDDLVRELAAADLILTRYLDNICCDCELTTACIVLMENRFADGVKDILDFLKSAKDLLPLSV